MLGVSASRREARVITPGPFTQGIAEALRAIRWARFRLLLRMQDPLRLPAYAGSMFRGGFGHAFKRITCALRHGDCDACLLGPQCLYQYVFESIPSADGDLLRKDQAAPHPFIIEPPLDGRRDYAPGDHLELGLTLIGRGVDCLPYFIVAFDELGRTGLGRANSRFLLTEVLGESPNGGGDGWRPIYTGAQRHLCDDFRIRSGAGPWSCPCSQDSGTTFVRDQQHEHDHGHVHEHDHGSSTDHVHGHEHGSLTVRFLTPTRLKYDSHLTADLEFHILIRNLLRRLSALSSFHCGSSLDLDFRGLVERAQAVKTVGRDLRWVDWERYSARQQTTLLMGGFLGTATFRGPLAEFLPLLRLGQHVHIGKGTVFGLGLYRLQMAAPE